APRVEAERFRHQPVFWRILDGAESDRAGTCGSDRGFGGDFTRAVWREGAFPTDFYRAFAVRPTIAGSQSRRCAWPPARSRGRSHLRYISARDLGALRLLEFRSWHPLFISATPGIRHN